MASGDLDEGCGPRLAAANIWLGVHDGPQLTGHPASLQVFKRGEVECCKAKEVGHMVLPISFVMGACFGMVSSFSNTETICCSTWSGAKAWIFGGKGDGVGCACLSGGPKAGGVEAAEGSMGGGAATCGLALVVLN